MQSVMITGGTGSFGHAMVKRLQDKSKGYPPDRIVIYSRDEQKQDRMAYEFPQTNMRFFIGDIRDESRLTMAMRGIETVFHAAALKIVPIAEYNPFEVVQTNIHGAENVVRAAIASQVGEVIALSTDKAVNPINLYGATKLAAEKIFIAANNLSAGRPMFSVVRYGNVVGSRGSVLPFFLGLARDNKTLTITDQRMTRFWIEMKDVIDFTSDAHTRMMGREIFIPRIPSIRIIDLAKAISESIKFVGIRPGEKISEVLLTEDESRSGAWDYGHGIVIAQKKPEYALNAIHEDFRYSSDGNDQWLTREDLQEWLKSNGHLFLPH